MSLYNIAISTKTPNRASDLRVSTTSLSVAHVSNSHQAGCRGAERADQPPVILACSGGGGMPHNRCKQERRHQVSTQVQRSASATASQSAGASAPLRKEGKGPPATLETQKISTSACVESREEMEHLSHQRIGRSVNIPGNTNNISRRSL